MDPNEKTPNTPATDTSAPVAPTPPESPVQQPTVSPAETPSVVPAVAPAPGSPIPTSGSSKKPKLGLILGIVGGALVLMLIVLGVILGFVFGSVSKKDYSNAVVQYNKLSSANSQVISDVGSLSSDITASDSKYESSLSDAEKSLAAIKTENDKLANMKAVKVGDGKKLYDTFNTKLKSYIQNGDDLVTTVKAARPAFVKCNASTTASAGDARLTALKDCSSALQAIGDVPSPEFKTYISSLQKGYAEYATNYQAMLALSDPYGAQYDQYKTLRDKVYATQEQLRTAAKTYRTDVEAKSKTLNVKESADALGKYLSEKQR